MAPHEERLSICAGYFHRIWPTQKDIRHKKCDNFVESTLVTNNGKIEFVESTYILKSYLLCQTFSATANGQIAISHYVLYQSTLH
jgi:hypothetical protein